MTRQVKLRTIKTTCWLGVAADTLWAFALVCPQLYGILTGRQHLQIDLFSRLIMAIAASLMLGWTLLLAWTARRPIERRAVLLITVFPVLLGLSIVTSIGMLNGNMSSLWILIKCAFLSIALLAAYRMASTIAREDEDESYY